MGIAENEEEMCQAQISILNDKKKIVHRLYNTILVLQIQKKIKKKDFEKYVFYLQSFDKNLSQQIEQLLQPSIRELEKTYKEYKRLLNLNRRLLKKGKMDRADALYLECILMTFGRCLRRKIRRKKRKNTL